ncbi:MAG: hypothetical protein GX488_03820 [Clostridiales bacterium]|nr:hypothetical protein [Clostridiales bacterium]
MLQIRSTENLAGISVRGNYDDLNELYNAFASVVGGEDDYLYETASRLRVLGVCNEIRHACIGNRELFERGYDIPCYGFRILWPEAAFVAAVLDNFVFLSTAKKLYVNRLPEEIKDQIQTVSADHISLIHFFQDLVWNELERVIGGRQIKKVFGRYDDLRSMHFKYPQFDGFYTQWLDLLNIKYLCYDPKIRGAYLAPVLAKLFSADEEYLSLKSNIDSFARQEGICVTGVRFAYGAYPDNIKW